MAIAPRILAGLACALAAVLAVSGTASVAAQAPEHVWADTPWLNAEDPFSADIGQRVRFADGELHRVLGRITQSGWDDFDLDAVPDYYVITQARLEGEGEEPTHTMLWVFDVSTESAYYAMICSEAGTNTPSIIQNCNARAQALLAGRAIDLLEYTQALEARSLAGDGSPRLQQAGAISSAKFALATQAVMLARNALERASDAEREAAQATLVSALEARHLNASVPRLTHSVTGLNP